MASARISIGPSASPCSACGQWILVYAIQDDNGFVAAEGVSCDCSRNTVWWEYDPDDPYSGWPQVVPDWIRRSL